MRWLLLLFLLVLGSGCAHAQPRIPLAVGKRVTLTTSEKSFSGEYHGETEDTILLVDETSRVDVPKKEIVSMQAGDPARNRRKRMIAGGVVAGTGAALGVGGVGVIVSAQPGQFVDISGPQRVLGAVMAIAGGVMAIVGIVVLANGD